MLDQSKTIEELTKMNPQLRLMHVLAGGNLTSRKLYDMGIYSCYHCGWINDLSITQCAKCKEERYVVCEDNADTTALKSMQDTYPLAAKKSVTVILRHDKFMKIRDGQQTTFIKKVNFYSTKILGSNRNKTLTLKSAVSSVKIQVNVLHVFKRESHGRQYYLVEIELRKT